MAKKANATIVLQEEEIPEGLGDGSDGRVSANLLCDGGSSLSTRGGVAFRIEAFKGCRTEDKGQEGFINVVHVFSGENG